MATAKKTTAPKTTAVTKAKASLPMPADAAERMRADMEAMKAKLAAPGGDGIQVTQSKEFKLPDGSKVDEFKGIIVDFVSFNAFYEGAYNADNVVPPNCFAIGTVKNDDLVPSDAAPDRQDDDCGSCKGCWANAFKSADNGKGKACKQSIRVAVLLDDGELHRLNISSTGLTAFGAYVRDVAGNLGAAPYGVMTTFTFDDKFDYPSVRCGDPVTLNDDQLAYVFSKRDDALAMLMVEPDVSEFQAKVVDARNKPKGRAAAATTSKAPAGRRRAA